MSLPLHPSERRGLFALAFTLFLALCALLYMHYFRPVQGEVDLQSVSETERYVWQKGKVGRADSQRVPRYYAQPGRCRESFTFDPNTADSSQLLRLGLTPAMVRGIYKYRSLGYTYAEVEDFARVPGMTRGLWEHLRPLIRIAAEFRPVQLGPRASKVGGEVVPLISDGHDTLQRVKKLRPGARVDLNTADTATLCRIPGVGRYFSQRIVSYRMRLGGFVATEQLQEIEGLPLEVADYVSIDTKTVQRISLNKATRRQLIQHPYILVYRAEDIWDYRHSIGPISGPEVLRSLPHFSPSDVERLLPYLDFSL